MKYRITVTCDECKGQGEIMWGNPLDPSTNTHPCHPCHQRGSIQWIEEYDSKEQALEDYPDAIVSRYFSNPQ